MKIEIPKNYKKTKGKVSRFDRYLNVKMTEDDRRFFSEHLLLDHAETFKKDKNGERILVAHVYPSCLDDNTIRKMNIICDRSGILYKVFEDSWYSERVKRIEYYHKTRHEIKGSNIY